MRHWEKHHYEIITDFVKKQPCFGIKGERIKQKWLKKESIIFGKSRHIMSDINKFISEGK